jgi:uncharacterized protein (TIGR02246 family)
MTATGRATLVLVALTGLAPMGRPLAAQAGGSDSTAIVEAARQFSAAYMRGDAAAMAALYTPDAVIFPERSNAITGVEAIKRYFTLGPGQRVTQHQLTPTSVVVDGSHAYDHGTYVVAGARDGKAWGPFAGKYLVVWRREPAGWRMQLDIWNSGPSSGS